MYPQACKDICNSLERVNKLNSTQLSLLKKDIHDMLNKLQEANGKLDFTFLKTIISYAPNILFELCSNQNNIELSSFLKTECEQTCYRIFWVNTKHHFYQQYIKNNHQSTENPRTEIDMNYSPFQQAIGMFYFSLATNNFYPNLKKAYQATPPNINEIQKLETQYEKYLLKAVNNGCFKAFYALLHFYLERQINKSLNERIQSCETLLNEYASSFAALGYIETAKLYLYLVNKNPGNKTIWLNKAIIALLTANDQLSSSESTFCSAYLCDNAKRVQLLLLSDIAQLVTKEKYKPLHLQEAIAFISIIHTLSVLEIKQAIMQKAQSNNSSKALTPLELYEVNHTLLNIVFLEMDITKYKGLNLALRFYPLVCELKTQMTKCRYLGAPGMLLLAKLYIQLAKRNEFDPNDRKDFQAQVLSFLWAAKICEQIPRLKDAYSTQLNPVMQFFTEHSIPEQFREYLTKTHTVRTKTSLRYEWRFTPTEIKAAFIDAHTHASFCKEPLEPHKRENLQKRIRVVADNRELPTTHGSRPHRFTIPGSRSSICLFKPAVQIPVTVPENKVDIKAKAINSPPSSI